MKILVTGSAGFIGYHLVNVLSSLQHEIIGLDNVNDYYDTSLKFARLEESGISSDKIEYGKIVKSRKLENYSFIKLDLEDRQAINTLFAEEKFDRVCHLAAQAGVRYSIINPHAYINSNITGFLNILEACRNFGTSHLAYASSSSVYGLNSKMPFSTSDNVDHPVSIYAATKKANELMAHVYSHLYNVPCTGLRFFTVYGPWGRPDMAYFKFTESIMAGREIEVYNNGNMRRDFTYIDDIIEGVVRVIMNPPSDEGLIETEEKSVTKAGYRIYNIGNSSPVNLLDFISAIEQSSGKTAKLKFMPMQPGDVVETYADVSDLEKKFGWKPSTDISHGIKSFVDWFSVWKKR